MIAFSFVYFWLAGAVAYFWFQREVPVVDEYVPELNYFLSPIMVSGCGLSNMHDHQNSGHFDLSFMEFKAKLILKNYI